MKTPTQLRQLADAIEAHERGEPVEIGFSNTDTAWASAKDSLPPKYSVSYNYRPAPKLVTRPWSKPEDVPGPVCWLRDVSEPCNQ